MIINLLLNVIVLVLGAVFSWLPVVDTLPTIGGYDIDTALMDGIGRFNIFTNAFWPLAILLNGFLVLMGYFVLKMVVKFFLGHRTPGH